MDLPVQNCRVPEKTTQFWDVKNHGGEKYKKDSDTDNIFHSVIRVKRNPVQRNAVFILGILYLHPIRVVGSNFMKRDDMQKHQEHQDQGNGDHMKSEEAV